jgi:predicted lipid-binding transport protein (Tim44 family)
MGVMANRGDIIWLGVSSGVTGALVGGLMLGIGMAMVIEQKYVGFIFIIPGAPVAGLTGWLLSRRLAAQFPK